MVVFALDPGWNDFFTVGGFVVGVVGFVVGVVGFIVTIYQVWQAKSAARAAKAASERTLAESRASFARFVGEDASRLLSELRGAVNSKDWKHAAVRANDLADLLGTLHDDRSTTREAIASLREFGQKFTGFPAGESQKYPKTKWNELLADTQARLDQLRSPFREQFHDESNPRDFQVEVRRDRPSSTRQDEGGAGELGPQGDGRPPP